MAIVQIQLRHDTSSNWTSANPTLLSGEIGIETDTNKYKIGNGSTSWNSLSYVIALPAQSGNSGKYLTTDGSTASWATVTGALAQTSEPSSPTDGLIWLDTDGTSPTTVVTRWQKTGLAAGTTSLSGNDDNSLPLTYTPGYEQVFLNGALLSRGNDYTATSGTSITLTTGVVSGDLVEVICATQITYADAIPQSTLTAKGNVLSASGSGVPAILSVGTDGQYLKADSTANTGLSWATLPSSGSLTLIAETVANADTAIDFSSISGSYTNLVLQWHGLYHSTTGSWFGVRANSDSGANYQNEYLQAETYTPVSWSLGGQAATEFCGFSNQTSSTTGYQTASGTLIIYNYASTTKTKFYTSTVMYQSNNNSRYNYIYTSGFWNSTSAITSLNIFRGLGTATLSNLSNSSIRLYGVK